MMKNIFSSLRFAFAAILIVLPVNSSVKQLFSNRTAARFRCHAKRVASSDSKSAGIRHRQCQRLSSSNSKSAGFRHRQRQRLASSNSESAGFRHRQRQRLASSNSESAGIVGLNAENPHRSSLRNSAMAGLRVAERVSQLTCNAHFVLSIYTHQRI